METPKIQFSFDQILKRFKFGGGTEVSADLLWQLVLGGGLIGIAVIMTFAYITYDWAMSVDVSSAPAQKTRDTLSVAEIEGVITVYKDKEAESQRLLRNPPHAPDFHKGHGIAVTPSTISSTTPVQGGATSSPR